MRDAAARYRPLGAFRFGLALLVVLQHFQHLLPLPDRSLLSAMGFGALAVASFFAVSGFVVAEAMANFYAGRPGAFLANRALRLVPPYATALLLAVLVHAVLWHSGRLVLWDYRLSGSPLAPARLLSGVLGLVPGFRPGWFGQDFEFIPFVWSLRLEVAFYIAAAGALLGATFIGRNWPVAVAILVGLAGSAAFLLLARGPGALSTAPMFLVGVCLYLWDTRPGWGRGVLLAVAAVLAAAGFTSWRQHGAPVLAWQLPLLAVLLLLFAWLARAGRVPWRRHLDRRLGDLSYPLYLNHYVIGIVASSLARRESIGLFAVAMIGAVGLAALAERLVDRPLRRFRDRVRAVTL